jgi:hypothetical protein
VECADGKTPENGTCETKQTITGATDGLSGVPEGWEEEKHDDDDDDDELCDEECVILIAILIPAALIVIAIIVISLFIWRKLKKGKKNSVFGDPVPNTPSKALD